MAAKFKAFCSVCYSCELTRAVGIREAERAATEHMNVYRHNTFILEERQPEIDPKEEL